MKAIPANKETIARAEQFIKSSGSIEGFKRITNVGFLPEGGVIVEYITHNFNRVSVEFNNDGEHSQVTVNNKGDGLSVIDFI